MGDRKEEVVTTPLSEKKSSTNDVDKGTYELEGMKKAVVTIRRKGLDKFESQSKGYTGCFKLDSGLKRIKFLQLIYNAKKNILKRIFNIKTRNCIQRLFYRLIKNISRKNM